MKSIRKNWSSAGLEPTYFCFLLPLSKLVSTSRPCGNHFPASSSLWQLLFSVHISYGKGKYLNQKGFFLQNLPRIYLYQS